MDSAAKGDMADNNNTVQWEIRGLIVAAGIGLFYLLLTCLQPVRTDDTFFHLKMGEVLWQGKEFPAQDPFLFTSNEDSYPLYHSWLFQVGIHLVHAQWGMSSVRILTALLALLACGAVIYWARGIAAKGHFPWLASGALLFFSYQRLIQLRPHMLSVIFFFFLLGFLWRHQERMDWSARLVCVVTMIIWANVHSVALIVFPFWLLFLILLWFSRRSTEVDLAGHWINFVLSLGAVSLTPLGWKLYFFYWLGQSRNPYAQVIDEWGHWNPFGVSNFLPLSSPILVCAVVLLLLVFLFRLGQGMILVRRQGTQALAAEPLILAFWGLAAAALMLFAVRFFWMAPLIVSALVFFPQKRQHQGGRWRYIVGTLLWILAVFLHFQAPGTKIYHYPWQTPEQRSQYLHQDIDERRYHWKAIQFLQNLGLEGRVFNPYHLGGVLSFGLHPQIRTFIDGRFEHYLYEVNRDQQRIESVGENFVQLLEKYNVELCFVPISRYSVRLRIALQEIDWVLVYTNSQTQIYCRPDLFARYRTTIMAYYDLEGDAPLQKARKLLYDRLLTSTLSIPSWPLEAVTTADPDYLEKMNLLLQHLFIPEARYWYQTPSGRLNLQDARLSDFRFVFAHYNQIRAQLKKEERRR